MSLSGGGGGATRPRSSSAGRTRRLSTCVWQVCQRLSLLALLVQQYKHATVVSMCLAGVFYFLAPGRCSIFLRYWYKSSKTDAEALCCNATVVNICLAGVPTSQFTCFTSTKVQILTQKIPTGALKPGVMVLTGGDSQRAAAEVRNLLALPVQKCTY